MGIYKGCGDEELESHKKGLKCLKKFGRGTNTFTYNKEKGESIHFFLFVESVYHYSEYRKSRFKDNFIGCDIPFELLKKVLWIWLV